jgi:hypothetical protein
VTPSASRVVRAGFRDHPREMTAPQDRESTETNVSGAVYGQVLATSLVVALGHDKALGALEMLVVLAVTMTVFWLAHVYSEAVAGVLRYGRHVSLADLRRLAAGEWPIAEAAGTSLLALALGAVGVLDRQQAIWLAIALGIADLCAWGWRIGRRWHRSWRYSLALAGASGLVALPVVALKVFIH